MDIRVQAFLDAIHQHHICRLGPADYLQVQELLVVRPDLNRAELQVALASLLATNQEQWQQITRLFEQYYPEAVTPKPPRGHASQPDEGPDASVHQPPMPDRPRGSAPERRPTEPTERTHAPGALTDQVARLAPLDAQAIDDAASLLGRLWHAVGSDDLDVPATVRTSIDAGGRLIPIYADRPVARALTVLVDVERGDHPWLSGITWVLERWHTLGVRYNRFNFRFEPLFVTVHTTGQAIALSHLARHTDGGPLVVISRTLSTRGYRTDAGWLKEMAAWPVKAWLDPDPRPRSERRRERQDIRRLEQQYGLQRFPFSAAGLLALARYLAADGRGVPSPAWPPLLPLDHPALAEALPTWALLAALVPDPTWDQLDAIRRHFPELSRVLPEPRSVQRLIDWVARTDQEPHPESEDGRTLVLSPALVDRLIRQQRVLDTGQPRMQSLESRGRQLLLQQLDATRPDDALLELFWDLKRVFHRLYLEPEQALVLVAPLLGSAVEPELLQVVETALALEDMVPRFDPGIRHGLELLVGRTTDRLQPLGMTFVLIPAGEFRMGSEEGGAYDDEKPVHSVRITQALYLGKYAVTQRQWQVVMGNNLRRCTDDANRPVERVSWNDVQEFIRRLNAREGGATYRLPTEAEWEYAARAGSTTAYSFGDDDGQLDAYAWYVKNTGNTTYPVGQKLPNAWGLYDMHGNVWEWVQDRYDRYPAGSAGNSEDAAVDPTGPATGGNRVLRGGSWLFDARSARSAQRFALQPGLRFADMGFRLARGQ